LKNSGQGREPEKKKGRRSPLACPARGKKRKRGGNPEKRTEVEAPPAAENLVSACKPTRKDFKKKERLDAGLGIFLGVAECEKARG